MAKVTFLKIFARVANYALQCAQENYSYEN